MLVDIERFDQAGKVVDDGTNDDHEDDSDASFVFHRY